MVKEALEGVKEIVRVGGKLVMDVIFAENRASSDLLQAGDH